MKTFLLLLAFAIPASAQSKPISIDAQHSKVTIHVAKSGVFSFAAGHDHEVSAPLTSGQIVTGKSPSVTLRFDARKLQVLDPKESDKNRAEIQKTMLSDKVLNAEEFPEIRFHSTKLSPAGKDQWNVSGDLTLHGQTKSLTVPVHREGKTYLGEARFKQTDFGITPVSIAGGTVKVKDEVKISFDIVPK